ncbi:MAG: sporulation protein YqfD [Ruminococcus sp.]|nr:sporulation protein YqfD [Ruminococcus sp.]
MFDNIRGIITFEAVAPETEAFVNALKESSAPVSDMRVRNGRIYGDIYHSDFDEVKKAAEKLGAQFSVRSKRGAVFTVRKYRRRFGMLIGFALAFALVVYLSNVVMVVEVYGNENLSDKQITSLLADQGIHIGAFIPSVDLREAESRIVSSSDNIAWIGLRSKGCIIQAEVSEIEASPEIVPTSVPCNIISSRDAQIVAVNNVHMGMLVRMLHDGVKKGDLLISGTVEDGKGGVYFAHSMGEIIGRYTEKAVFKQSFEDERFDYGEKILRKKLYFFGAEIPLYIGRNKFGNCEYDETTDYAELFGIRFPVGIVKAEYKPYEIRPVTYSSEQAKVILEDKIKQYERNFLNGGDITVVDKEVFFSEDGKEAKAVVKYTLESDIGVTQEIMAK